MVQCFILWVLDGAAMNERMEATAAGVVGSAMTRACAAEQVEQDLSNISSAM
jgi:hypothetical protein